MAKNPTLESVVARAEADGKDDSFIRELTEDYHRRFPDKEEGLFSDFEEEQEVVEEEESDGPPPLEEVLKRAKADGKDQGFLDALASDYHKQFVVKKREEAEQAAELEITQRKAEKIELEEQKELLAEKKYEEAIAKLNEQAGRDIPTAEKKEEGDLKETTEGEEAFREKNLHFIQTLGQHGYSIEDFRDGKVDEEVIKQTIREQNEVDQQTFLDNYETEHPTLSALGIEADTALQMSNSFEIAERRVGIVDEQDRFLAGGLYRSLFGDEKVDQWISEDKDILWGLIDLGDTDAKTDQMMVDFAAADLETAELELQTGQFVEGNILSGTVNAVTSVLSSFGSAIKRPVTGLFSTMTMDAFIEANRIEAEKKGVTLEELVFSDDAKVVAPIAFGSVMTALEGIGLGAVGKFLIKTGSKTIGKGITTYLLSNSTEALTEWLQTGTESANAIWAETNGNVAATAEGFVKSLFTLDALEAAIQGFVGAGAIGGPKIAAQVLKRKNGVQIEDTQEKLGVIADAKLNRNLSDIEVLDLQAAEANLKGQLEEQVKQPYRDFVNVEAEGMKQLHSLNDKITTLHEKALAIEDGALSDDQKKLLIQEVDLEIAELTGQAFSIVEESNKRKQEDNKERVKAAKKAEQEKETGGDPEAVGLKVEEAIAVEEQALYDNPIESVNSKAPGVTKQQAKPLQAPTKEQVGDPNALLKKQGFDTNQVEGILSGREVSAERAETLIENAEVEEGQESRLENLKASLKSGPRVTVSDTDPKNERSFKSGDQFYTIGNVQPVEPANDVARDTRVEAQVKTETVEQMKELAEEGTPVPEIVEAYKEELVNENGKVKVYRIADQTVEGNAYDSKGVAKKSLSGEWSLAPVEDGSGFKYQVLTEVDASVLESARLSDGKIVVDAKISPKQDILGTNKPFSQTSEFLNITEGFKQKNKTAKAIKAFQHGKYPEKFTHKFFQRVFSSFRTISLKAVQEGSMEVYTSAEVKEVSNQFHEESKKRKKAAEKANGGELGFIKVRMIRAEVAEELSAKTGIPSSIVAVGRSFQNTDYLYFKNENLAVSTVNGTAETVYFSPSKDGYTHGTLEEMLAVEEGGDITHNPDISFWESKSAFAKLHFYEVAGAKIDIAAGNEFVNKHLPGYNKFDNVLAAEMERLIDIRNQERAVARDGVTEIEEDNRTGYQIDSKNIGNIRSDINAIINNINSITNESTFKAIQSIIGSTEEAQNATSPLNIFAKGKTTPTASTVARLFSGSDAQGRSNQVALKKAYLNEARLKRTANWNSSFLSNTYNDADSALGGSLSVSKTKLDSGTHGAYVFDPNNKGSLLYNDNESTLDTIWHEITHWWDQQNMLTRPELTRHINNLVKGHVQYDTTKELMDNLSVYEAFRNEAGYSHEAQARVMGYESVRVLENWDDELGKPSITTKEHLSQRYVEILEDIDSRINSIQDIKTMNDAAKVMIIETMTGKDFFTGKSILPSVTSNKAASKNAFSVITDKVAEVIASKEEAIVEGPPVVWSKKIEEQAEVIKNVAGNPEMSERDIVIELTKQEVFGFMQEVPGHIDELQDKATYENKPTAEIQDAAGILASEKDQKVAEETVLKAIAQGKTMGEVSQGTGSFFKDYDDAGISARMAYVLQDLRWGDKVGSLVFQLGAVVFPGLKAKIEDPNAPKSIKGADVKTAQGVLGTHTLQLLIDAGLIDFDKKWDNATRKIINVVKFVDQKKFDAWIQSQSPEKVKNHVPRGSLPYFQNEDGTWEDSSWSEPNQDGMAIVGGKYDKQLLKELTKEAFPKVYQEANSASEQIILIEQHMLATYQNMIDQPAFTFSDQKLDAGALRSKIQKIVADLKMAEYIGDRPYKQRAVYELRSRLRSAMKALNHQGDKMGMSMIMFNEPVTTGIDGMEGMLIQSADTFGFKGRDFDERVAYARKMFPSWMKWASDPVKYYKDIFAADEPWVFLATINELHNALAWAKKEGKPVTSFKSGLPFHTDQTASGLGVITTIMQDSEHAGTLNVDDDQERGDPYTELGLEFFEKQGVHSQETMNESEAMATEWSQLERDFYGSKSKTERDANKAKLDEFLKRYPKKKRNEMKQAYFSRLKIKGKYTRKMGKIIAMTKYFGGKIMGMSEQVMNELAPKVKDFPGMPSEWAMSVAVDLDDAANSRFKAAARYMDITGEIGRDTAEQGTRFTAPVNGMSVKNRPNKFVPAQVPNKRYRGKNDKFGKDVSTKYRRKTDNADSSKAATQIASFITHMSDAQIVAWLFLNYTKAGNQLLTIHDNFLVPVGQWRELYRELRKGYKEVFSGDYLAGIIREIYENNGNPEKAEDIINRLQIGDLDISEMDLSDHIFNSGNGLERLTPLPGIHQVKEGKKAMEAAQQLLLSEKEQQIKNCK